MGHTRQERKLLAARRRRLETLRGLSGSESPVCACCREHRLWALTIDHIEGGGVQHRKNAGYARTADLVRREWRELGRWPTERYQVLCATCNHGRRVDPDGICPHQREEVTE